VDTHETIHADNRYALGGEKDRQQRRGGAGQDLVALGSTEAVEPPQP